MWACETLADAAAGSGHAVGYPTREQSAVLSPTGPACVPQDHLEPVLLAHLHALPAAKVVLGTEVAHVLDGPDGAHSAVRRAVGLPMHGPDRLAAAATALFRASARAMASFISKHAVWGNGGRAPGFARSGSTPGTSTWAESRHDGVDLVFTLNTRNWPPNVSSSPVTDLKSRLGNMLDSVSIP